METDNKIRDLALAISNILTVVVRMNAGSGPIPSTKEERQSILLDAGKLLSGILDKSD